MDNELFAILDLATLNIVRYVQESDYKADLAHRLKLKRNQLPLRYYEKGETWTVDASACGTGC